MKHATRSKHFHLQQTHKYPIYNFDHVQWTEFHVFTKLHKQKKFCPSCLADCFATANVVHVIRHAPYHFPIYGNRESLFLVGLHLYALCVHRQ